MNFIMNIITLWFSLWTFLEECYSLVFWKMNLMPCFYTSCCFHGTSGFYFVIQSNDSIVTSCLKNQNFTEQNTIATQTVELKVLHDWIWKPHQFFSKFRSSPMGLRFGGFFCQWYYAILWTIKSLASEVADYTVRPLQCLHQTLKICIDWSLLS